MSGKVKMRCAQCGKPFKSANARQILCDACEAKERAARAAGRSAAANPSIVAPTPVAKPKIVGAGARILDPSLPPEPAPASVPPAHARASVAHDRPAHEPAHESAVAPSPGGRPARASSAALTPRKDRPARSDASPQKRPPKAPRAPRAPQPPVELTAEQRSAVEARYLELATPVEFDGIRTRIAADLGLPKSAVKKAVADLRQRMQMPSWWELQAYKGSEEDLERVRRAYTPLLPLPEVGVHKRIGAELNIDQMVVYQAIRRIRSEMRLPQYNPRDQAPIEAAPRS